MDYQWNQITYPMDRTENDSGRKLTDFMLNQNGLMRRILTVLCHPGFDIYSQDRHFRYKVYY